MHQFDVLASDVTLAAAPLFHIGGLSVITLVTFCRRRSGVVALEFRPCNRLGRFAEASRGDDVRCADGGPIHGPASELCRHRPVQSSPANMRRGAMPRAVAQGDAAGKQMSSNENSS